MTCTGGSYPDAAGTTCIQPAPTYYAPAPVVCASNQVITSLGACYTCQAGAWADAT